MTQYRKEPPDWWQDAETEPLLDTQETSVDSNDSHSFRQFMISGVKKDVAFNEKIYRILDHRDNSKRFVTYLGCRTSAWFVRHKLSGMVKLISSRCNLRWCPLCIRTKRRVMTANIIPWVEKARNPKFLTFTLKHSNAPLEFQIDTLYQAFRKIRVNRLMKKNAKGGIWFFQVKRSKSDGLWHPHLHCLVEGNFIPKGDLSDAWLKVTGTSKIVDIRAIKDPKKTAEYVARYASAPCRLSDFSEDDAVSVVDALHSRRVCGTWGTGKAVKLTPGKMDDTDGWEYLAGYREVLMCRHRSDWHAQVYHAFIKEESCCAVPDPPPPKPWADISHKIDEPITHKQLTIEWTDFLG